MAQDIRLNVEFYGHPKTVRFHKRAGDHGIVCLTRLWTFAAKYFPKGILTGMTAEDIAAAAGWTGAPEEFVAALLEAGGPGRAGFLDLVDTNGIRGYEIHDWSAHNPFAYFKEERSEIARNNIQKRWSKKRKHVKKQKEDTKGNTNGIPAVYGQNTPSPTPSPSPKGREEGDPALALDASGASAHRSIPEPEVVDPEEQERNLKAMRELTRKIGGPPPGRSQRPHNDDKSVGEGNDKGNGLSTDQKVALANVQAEVLGGILSPDDALLRLEQYYGFTADQVDQAESLLAPGRAARQ